MIRHLEIAQATLHRPQLLFVDEPWEWCISSWLARRYAQAGAG